MNTDRQAVKHAAWLADPLPGDVALSIERLCRADDVRHVAAMPDVLPHTAAPAITEGVPVRPDEEPPKIS